MNCLVIGDIHIQPSNISDVNILLKNLKEYIDSNIDEIDFFVVLGDTLHTHERLDSISLSKATEYFELLASYGKEVFILVGNHDFISNTQFLNTNHWLNPFKKSSLNITIVDDVIVRTFETNKQEYSFIFLPYVPDGRFKEALELKLGRNPLENWYEEKKYTCIFCHQLFDGIKMGAITAKDVEKWDIPIQIVSGHIHDKQEIKYLYYTGSSLQHGYSDNDDKTVALCMFNSNNVKFEEVNLHPPKKRLLYVESCDNKLINLKIKPYLDDIKSGMLSLKLSMTCSYEEYKAFRGTKYYKDLKQLGILLDFKKKELLNVNNIKDKIDSKIKSESFLELLDKNIKKENNEKLTEFYLEMIGIHKSKK